MNEEAATTTVPQSRTLARPYFLLRTPDGLESFFRREYVKALFSPKDPLTRFLAPATLNKTKQPPEVVFDYNGLPLDTFRPLDYISEGELRLFREAAEDFYGKARAQVSNVTPFEKDLRRSFRLPDPEKEPDAYWLYGPPHDRRLLVLWGAEIERDSSIPICAVDGVTSGPNVLDKLSERVLPWEGKQRQAIDLAVDRKEAIANHVALVTYNARNEMASVAVAGKRYNPGDLKPAKAVSTGQIEALNAAGMEFYNKAFAPEASDFEKELRLSLRLADPSKKPDSWRILKGTGHLVALVDGKELRSETLAVTDVPEHDFPPQTSGESTIVAELRGKIRPWWRVALPIAAAAAVVIAVGSYFLFIYDRTPPSLVKVEAINDPQKVVLFFDEPIDPASLQPATAGEGGEVAPSVQPLALRRGRGAVEGFTAAVDEAEPYKVVLTMPAPMGEGDSYTLALNGIRDHNGNSIQAIEQNFYFRDLKSPQPVGGSADPMDTHVLLLSFNEPLDEKSASDERNYKIEGVVFDEAKPSPGDPSLVLLRARDPLENGVEYRIEVSGVGDQSAAPNRNLIPYDNPAILDFRYVDSTAPRVTDVRAAENQVNVKVFFDERINANSVTTGNFSIQTPSGEALPVTGASLLADAQTVGLRVPPMKNGVEYTLTVKNVTDLATDPPNEVRPDVSYPFRYTGPIDQEQPYIAAIDAQGDNQTMRVTFNEEVTSGSVESLENFVFSDPGYKVIEVRPVSGNPRSYFVKLNDRLSNDPDREYNLTVKELVDLIGNKSNETRSRAFKVKGLTALQPRVMSIESVGATPDGSAVEVYLTDAPADGPTLDPANWSVSNAVIVNVRIDNENPKKITLVLQNPIGSGTHVVTARNLPLKADPSRRQVEMIDRFTR